jgi:hypothetical protein
MVTVDAQAIPEGMRRRQRRDGAGLLPLLLICTVLVSVGGCAPGGSSGKHTGMWQAIRMFDAQHGWASTHLAILITSDGGTHWHDVTPWQTLSPGGT